MYTYIPTYYYVYVLCKKKGNKISTDKQSGLHKES